MGVATRNFRESKISEVSSVERNTMNKRSIWESSTIGRTVAERMCRRKLERLTSLYQAAILRSTLNYVMTTPMERLVYQQDLEMKETKKQRTKLDLSEVEDIDLEDIDLEDIDVILDEMGFPHLDMQSENNFTMHNRLTSAPEVSVNISEGLDYEEDYLEDLLSNRPNCTVTKFSIHSIRTEGPQNISSFG